MQKLPNLDRVLDGRKLNDLLPQEIFTLAKALPIAVTGRVSEIYREVLRDLIRNGTIDKPTALADLTELRQNLGLRKKITILPSGLGSR